MGILGSRLAVRVPSTRTGGDSLTSVIRPCSRIDIYGWKPPSVLEYFSEGLSKFSILSSPRNTYS